MLTPQDVKNKEFTKAVFGGYDMAAVDDFLEILVEDYSSLYKESAILKNKLKVLVEKVEEYRSTEDAMRMALLTAQKMSREIVDEATSKSKSMVEDAEIAARTRIESLRIDIKEEEHRLEAARKATVDFVNVADEICKKHIDFLTNVGRLVVRREKETEIVKPAPISQEDQMDEAARTIEGSVAKIYENTIRSEEAEKSDPADVFSEFEDDADLASMQEDEFDENTKVFTPVNSKNDAESDEMEDPVTPKPKFNFTNLQFGSNYDQKK